MPDLTVCIPAFNAAHGIERSIRSIISQDVDADVEILVCNDGSTDGTPSALERLSNEVPNLRVLTNDHNRGRPFTRNRLLSEARGRFLTWLDADDFKYEGMLRAQLEHLRALETIGGPDASHGVLVYTNYDWWWQDADEPKLMCPEQPDDPMEALLSAGFGGYLWLMMGTTATFREAGPFDEALPRLQDLGFFIRFAELGGRFEHVGAEEPMCVYNKEDGGRDALVVWRSWCRIWRRYKHHYRSYGARNARRWRRHHYRVSRRFAKNNADRFAYWYLATLEVMFIIRGRFRRVLFDA